MMKLTKSLLAPLALLAASPAWAHPGHAADPATHWVADLPHLAVVAALVLLGYVAVQVGLAWWTKRR